MTTTTVIMVALTFVAAILWALRFVPTFGMPPDLASFFGGMAIGFGFGAAVTWAAERTPPD